MKHRLWLWLALAPSILLGACGASGTTMLPDAAAPDLAPLGGLRPPARKDIDGVVVAGTKKLLVYGGDQAPPSAAIPAPKVFVEDLWRLDLASGAWEKPSLTGTTPGARGGYAATFDSKRNRMILVGGRKGTDMSPPIVGDVWALDAATLTWTPLMPTGTAPSPRVGHRVAYDADFDRLLMVGGDTSKIFGNGIVADNWELSFAGGADGAWNRLPSTGGPGARRDVGLGLDPARKLLVVFGGATSFQDYVNDVFVFDLASNTWKKPTSSGTLPTERFAMKMERDPIGDRFILFGGHDPLSLGVLNDTFALSVDGTTARFAQLLAGDADVSVAGVDHTSPERREKHALASAEGKLWVYGGSGDCGPLDDTWTLDFAAPTAWRPLYTAMVGETCQRRATAGQQCMDPSNDCTNPF
jgi:hypothetical protein